MASQDLQSFVETRLQVLVPGIDLSAGSPAQVQFITPLLTYLGTDPFETDILTFITDRFTQEFPDVYNGDPSAVSDTLIKPLTLLLEPFKRETNLIKIGQSLEDPTVLSDDDADALVANFFETRNTGGFSTGVGRVFFAQPQNVSVEMSTTLFTGDGLNFFPITPFSVTAEEMVFNRSGSLYFLDIPCKAENAGPQYNIDPNVNPLVGVSGIFGAVKVTNILAFQNGTSTTDTPTLVADAQESLTERSLVNRRGATARLNDVFQGEVRAIQVIGAKDPEMQRDILLGTSPGHAWLTGQVSLYKSIALVQCRTVDDPSTTTSPQPGDTLYIYLDKYSNGGAWASLAQNLRFVRFKVVQVISGPLTTTTSPFQQAYLVQFSGPLPVGITLPATITLEGGFAKVGTLEISSLPDIGAVNLTVANQSVHVFGHTDIYVRPVLQDVSKAVFSNIIDDPQAKYFTIQRSTLSTTATSNQVTDSIDFGEQGVLPGFMLTIETGNDAGVYTIGAVVGTSLYLTANLTTTTVGIRYRITEAAHINLFEPKIPKLPFGSVPNNDLQTVIGSDVFNFSAPTTDLVGYGSKVGDTLRVLTGTDAGDFTITGLTAGGKQITVDRPATSSNSGLVYQVFTKLDPVVLPLVRIKDLQLLDSSQQTTGISVPYGKPVAVVPTCDMTSAQVRGFSQAATGVVIPSLVNLDGSTDPFVNHTNIPASSGDRRYSLGFDPTNGGTYKDMQFPNGAHAEFLFTADAYTSCSYFLARAEATNLSVNFPPVDPQTGDALTIKTGPNAGSYLIENVIKFHYVTAGGNTVWLYFIKIYGSFPVDVLRDLIEFIDNNGVTVPKLLNSSGSTAFPDFFVNDYNNLGTYLNTALGNAGVSSPGASILQTAINNLAQVEYEWGDPARGTLRSFFTSPTLFEENTGTNNNPTLFSFETSSGSLIKYRPDPNLYLKQELIPFRLTADADPRSYPRDLTPGVGVATFTSATRSTIFNLAIQINDVISVHEEIFFHGSTGVYGTDHQTAVQSIAGSTTVTAPTSSGSPFTAPMIGNLVFIDQGVDSGGYFVVDVPDANTLVLDRPLQTTTPAIILQGNNAQWGYNGTDDVIVATGSPFTVAQVGQWVTIYGMDTRYQGSYQILGVTGTNTLRIQRPLAIGHFPAYPVGTGNAIWVVTAAPPANPLNTTLGTQLTGLQPMRMYNEIVTDYPITAVLRSPTTSQASVTGTMTGGVLEPFRIYRNNVRRVTSTEMNLNTEGPLFYFDTQVVSLGDSPAGNIPESSYLTVDEGTFECVGYLHIVDDNTLTYSMKESGVLVVPNKILPVGSADSTDNLLTILGAPLEVDYERADIVEQFQTFLDSPDDRITSANMLARHFLPEYISYDATYSGGSAPSVIASDILSYINNLPIETPLEVSKLEKTIDNDGGDPVVPTTVIGLIHDWDRNEWAEFSETQIGGTVTAVPYNGTPRVSYFVPGPDVSGQNPLPAGERINLTQT